MTSSQVLGQLDQLTKKDFENNRRILSFEEYLALLGEKPDQQGRGSARYLLDMMEHFGTTTVRVAGPQGPTLLRYNVFDLSDDATSRRVVGQEEVQAQIHRALRTFVRQGVNNKLILLHGSNGSAKTTIIHSLMAGLEQYSRESQGALYGFNWIFPIEKIVKGGIGLQSGYALAKDKLESFAKLADDEVLARIPCDLKDPPLLLLPPDQRRAFLEKLLGPARAASVWEKLPNAHSRGDLCHRCKQIFDALLMLNGGDLRKVLMHVQVERLYLSRRYRRGLVTIEPQLHVDAQYQQLTLNKGMGTLPPALQGLNLFTVTGDLIDANRGLVEFSDLLKRPVDTFKYLLIACETGAVNVGSTIAYLDTVMLGTTNEVQLDAFKEFPDFTSFKARIELIRVPYLLSVSDEMRIYEPELKQVAAEKHVAPHVGWALAQWAVLTRLKKPNSINYPPTISSLVSNLTPIEKARFYDTGEMPVALSADDRKVLRSAIRRLREEYQNIPYYEGRMGASAREMKSILFAASQNTEFPCLSPLAVFREMEEFVRRVSEYEFLKQDVKDGFHDTGEFINTVRTEYLSRIDREVRDSIGLYDSQQWEEFLRRYVTHVSLVLKKEKVKNPITGKLEDPDVALIEEFEKIVEAPSDAGERESFRQNIISAVGVWSLDHPNQPVEYASVFPQFWSKLEKHYYESQKALLAKMQNALQIYDKDSSAEGVPGWGQGALRPEDEGHRLALKTVDNMRARLGYCEHCAREVITFLMRQRY